MKSYLYIDESGVPDNPIDTNGQRKLDTPRVFCLGGIIADEQQKQFLETEHKRLLDDYFKEIQLEPNFKLHYNPLRMGCPPYSIIGRKRSQELEKQIFETIKRSNVKLLSFTLDLIRHYTKYTTPFDPLAYGLIIMFERFFNYLRKENIKTGLVIYERFNKGLRNTVYRDFKRLQKTKFKTELDLDEIIKYIGDGDPTQEPVLQFVDFWTYLPFLQERSYLDMQDYSNQYYRFNIKPYEGNVSMR